MFNPIKRAYGLVIIWVHLCEAEMRLRVTSKDRQLVQSQGPLLFPGSDGSLGTREQWRERAEAGQGGRVEGRTGVAQCQASQRHKKQQGRARLRVPSSLGPSSEFMRKHHQKPQGQQEQPQVANGW